jgi:hypothetical protein
LLFWIKQGNDYYMIVVLTTDTKRFRLLLLVIMLSLGVEQAKQGWYFLIFHPSSKNDNSSPFLGDNNGVAAGMVMLIPIIVYFARTTQHAWIRRGYWFLLVGCLFRALTSYSRGAFLACAVLGGVHLLRTFQKLRALAGILVIVTIVLPVFQIRSGLAWTPYRPMRRMTRRLAGSTFGKSR